MIKCENTSSSVDFWRQRHKAGKLYVDKTYQREFAFDNLKISKLIESLIIKVPIPPIYLYEEEFQNKYSIIDGQNRLLSIFNFMDNQIELKGLEICSVLNGSKFKDLSKEYQDCIKRTRLDFIIIPCNSPELIYEVFLRLNIGAVHLNAQELRNCIYKGPFNDMLNSLAKEKEKVLEILFGEINKRFSYQEKILRFLSLEDYSLYKKSFNFTINQYLSRHLNDTPKEIENVKNHYKFILNLCKDVLGENAFKSNNENKKMKINFYDSIMIAFSTFNPKTIRLNADLIRKNIEELKKSEEFLESFRANSSKVENVNKKILMVCDTIKNSITIELDENRVFDSYLKLDFFNKDTTCAICRQQILSINDAELDHIVPFSKGGKTVVENAQLVHSYCNKSKSNKME